MDWGGGGGGGEEGGWLRSRRKPCGFAWRTLVGGCHWHCGICGRPAADFERRRSQNPTSIQTAAWHNVTHYTRMEKKKKLYPYRTTDSGATRAASITGRCGR